MAYVPAVLIAAGIAVISLWENPHLPPEVMSLGDKALHGLMYAVLAVAWAVPVNSQITNHKSQLIRSIYVVIGVTAYGVLMEALQRFCTLTRSGEMEDVIADLIGAVVGVTIVVVMTLLRHDGMTKKS